MLGMLGQKIGMTRLVNEETGEVIPVTLVEIKKNTISRIKTSEKDGYNALVLGLAKKKNKADPFKYWGEFRVESIADFKAAGEIAHDIFTEGQTVTVQGISKGKGFQGVIKRHNFHRGPMSHGSDHHREPGSVGTRKPRRVKAGKKLPGRMGSDKVTIKGVQIIKIDSDREIIALKGPLPGAIKSLVKIIKEVE